jgi:hypothetical protein
MDFFEQGKDSSARPFLCQRFIFFNFFEDFIMSYQDFIAALPRGYWLEDTVICHLTDGGVTSCGWIELFKNGSVKKAESVLAWLESRSC